MNKLKILTVALLLGFSQVAYAGVFLQIQDAGNLIFSGEVGLPDAGAIQINDSNHVPHNVDARSVLNIIYNADLRDDRFNLSSLIYYESFSAFYLKCININYSNRCDDWQYSVNGTSPALGMDKAILSNGDSVSLYFGSEVPIQGVPAGGPLLDWPREPTELLPPPLEGQESATETPTAKESMAPGGPLLEWSLNKRVNERTEKLSKFLASTKEGEARNPTPLFQETVETNLSGEHKNITTGSCIFSKLVAYFKHENQKTSAKSCL